MNWIIPALSPATKRFPTEDAGDLVSPIFYRRNPDLTRATCLRHSYRSWLDAAGTPITVQRQCMRHSSITTTLDTYGAIVTDEVKQAESKVAGLVLPDFRVISARASA